MPRKTKAVKHTDRKKAWAKRKISASAYKEESRSPAKIFLIICEGMNTEPAYFKSFPLGNATVDSFGLGSSKSALVNQVIDYVNTDEDTQQKEVWVVFDFDIDPSQLEKQKEDFNNAIKLAESNNLKVAYSIDAFELWFILHYQDLTAAWTRKECYQKLSDLWGCNYEKLGKKMDFCKHIYRQLKEDENASQEEAIKRAKKLLEDKSKLSPADRNPCTAVYQLIMELREYL